MSDLICREDVYAAIRGLTRHIDRIAAITALPAVQPDARIKEYEEAYQYALHLAEALRKNYPPNHDFRFLGDLVGLLTQIDNMVAGLSQPAVQPDAIEALTAQLESTLRDRKFILEERDRTFALMLARAEKAEAERDRLREALEQFLIEYDVVDLANAEPSSLTAAVLEARAALKGESHD